MTRHSEKLRLVTPALVSVALFLLGLVYSSLRDVQRDVTDIRERLARVEVTQKIAQVGER